MPRGQNLWKYFLLTYLAVLVNAAVFLRQITYPGFLTVLFVAAVFLTYCLIYTFVAFVPPLLLNALLWWRRWGAPLSRFETTCSAVVYTLAVFCATFLQIFLFADGSIYRLFGFHFNGFVLNLLFTPGGVESLGGDRGSEIAFGLIVFGFLLVQVLLLAAVLWLRPLGRWWQAYFSRRVVLALVLLAVIAAASERVAYGLSVARDYSPIVVATEAIPFYLPLRFNNLAHKLGFASSREASFQLKSQTIRLHYPLRPIQRADHPRYNIVVLLVEALRADSLNPEIMPHTYAFAQRATWFQNHYSAGNGTRMGVFGLFYGLYGNYWFPFLAERRSPVLMDVLQNDGYQFAIHASASFNSPEFDKTIFRAIPPNFLHDESNGGESISADRDHTSRIIDFIDHRDPAKPFMAFMFYNSSHSNYHVDPNMVIRRPYLESFNYATTDIHRDIGLLRNRYLNACYFVDSQIDRVVKHLDEQGLLDSTILVIAGDHGEEFLEKGRWGHASAFTEEQTRTPMLLWVPGPQGRPATRITKLSSHLDIPTTILPLLGVTNPPEDYSLGINLLSPTERDYTVVSDWNNLAYVDHQSKAIFPLEAWGYTRQNRLTDASDNPLSDTAGFYQTHHDVLARLIKEMGRFGDKAR